MCGNDIPSCPHLSLSLYANVPSLVYVLALLHLSPPPTLTTKDLIAKYLTENAMSAQYWANKSIPKSLNYDYQAVQKKGVCNPA